MDRRSRASAGCGAISWLLFAACATTAAKPPPLHYPTTDGALLVTRDETGYRIQGPRYVATVHPEGLAIDGVMTGESLRVGRHLEPIRIELLEAHSYYVLIRLVADAGRGVIVERIYEMTDGPLVYVQLAIIAAGSGVRLHDVRWSFDVPNATVTPTAEVMLVDVPSGPLGGFDRDLSGYAYDSAPPVHGSWAIVDGGVLPDRRMARLREAMMLLAPAVISVAPPTGEGFALAPLDRHPFYVRYGIRAEGKAASPTPGWATYTFINWNRFEDRQALVPIQRGPRDQDATVRRDALIRTTMHLVRRMRFDGGWPRSVASSFYPRGDIFTAHAGAFGAALYLWARLSTEPLHAGDAQVIFEALLGTRPFFEGAFADMIDARGPSPGTPYLSYSAAVKERHDGTPRGVLNTHARALHFAWTMMQACLHSDRPGEAEAWRAIVERYHRGTEVLIDRLHPGHQNGTRYVGMLDYSLESSRISTVGGTSYYTDSSAATAAAGYLVAGGDASALLEYVEASTRWASNPLVPPAAPRTSSAPALRIARADPLALALIGTEPCVSHAFQQVDDAGPAAPTQGGRGAGTGGLQAGRSPPILTGSIGGRAARIEILAPVAVPGTATVTLSLDGAEVWPIAWVGWGPISGAAAGDFDGDGQTDLLLAGAPEHPGEPTGLDVGRWDGHRLRFTRWGNVVLGSGAQLAVADADGDGRDDLRIDRQGWPPLALRSITGACRAGLALSASPMMVSAHEIVAFEDRRIAGEPALRTHDPGQYVQFEDKWIRTSTPFTSSWVFWKAVAPDDVPVARRFEVTAPAGVRWAAYRQGARIELMAASDAALTLTVPKVGVGATVRVRRYGPGGWAPPSPPRVIAAGDRALVVPLSLNAKDRVRIELDAPAETMVDVSRARQRTQTR